MERKQEFSVVILSLRCLFRWSGEVFTRQLGVRSPRKDCGWVYKFEVNAAYAMFRFTGFDKISREKGPVGV